jgi:hypothetical protein
VDKTFKRGNNLVSVAAVCYVVKRMTESIYLLFGNNVPVLVEFCLCVLPRVNDLVTGSKHVEELLSELGASRAADTASQAHMIEELFDILACTFPIQSASEATNERTRLSTSATSETTYAKV